MKLVGAAYLIYIGLSALLSRSQETHISVKEISTVSKQSFRAIYLQGFLTNVLNPKVALFFMAFVPQFIEHDAPSKAVAFIVLGSVFVFNSLIYCHSLALFTAFASRQIKLNQMIQQLMKRSIGAVFVGLGIKLATANAS